MVVQKIESFRSKNPREYWKKLYDLDNTQLVDNSIPMVIKNSNGTLVSGMEASKLWMDSFAKLSKENSDAGDFDQSFYVHINDRINQFQQQSTSTQCTLDHSITLEEVQKAIKKLKKGKAVGLDGMFNEIFKYGGEKVSEYIYGKYIKRYSKMKNFQILGQEDLFFHYSKVVLLNLN